jgi:hypothetical protein
VERATIACESCERLWSLPCALTLYEKRALEAHACPRCGTYSLICREPEEELAPRGRVFAGKH